LKEESDDDGEPQHVEATSSSDTSANQSKSASQTRFSFYDAQEVQSKFLSTIPQKYQQRKVEEEENKNMYRFNFYDPASLPPGDVNNPIKINISGSGDVATNPGGQSVSSSQRYEPPQRPQPLFPREGLAPVDRNAMHHVSSQTSLHNNTSQHSHTDDILRSLQETEEQRMQILQPAGVLLSAPPHVAAAAEANNMSTSKSKANLTSSLVATNSGASSSKNSNQNNPYEDAIREALDLLRKHRSPPPSPSMNAIMGSASAAATASLGGLTNIPAQPRRTATTVSIAEEDAWQQSDDSRRIATTPAAAAATTPTADISTNDSLTDALQEAKLKAKQRQERMAEYASRLQEFKSSLPPEQQVLSESIQQQQSSQPQYPYDQPQPPLPTNMNSSPQIHPTSSILNDIDSVGLISDISQSTAVRPVSSSSWQAAQAQTYGSQPVQEQQRVVDEEVQKGVEKVLMAILEASKSNTSSNNSHVPDHGGGASSVVDTASTHSGVSEVLMKAMDEVLYGRRNSAAMNAIDSHASAVSTSTSGISKFSVKSHDSGRSKRSGGERSVVEELLAEPDEHPTSQYWPREEKKMTENEPSVASSSLAATMKPKTVFSDTTNNIKVSTEETQKDIDALIEESLRESDRGDTFSQEDTVSEEFDADEDDDLHSDYGEGGSYGDEDDESDHDDADDDANGSQPNRVLGPLSRKAGGTTGVVLDAASSSNPASPDIGEESKGYFSSVVKYVTSALTPDRERVIDNRKSQVEPVESDDSEERATEDVEAMELMRTLCAHLLPFGVDRQSNLEEVVPAWDEDNPNEAGYRIIRLSKSQLRRVERAFDMMINGLKFKSQSKLSLGEGEYDANFIRELQEVERLLDDEEKRNRTGELVQDENPKGSSCPPKPIAVETEFETGLETKEADALELCLAHPDFPGIKTAGKGEMGDLEFFHLPIIFKSHVTGFEPTKDMVLEPGNVVAGQYLVESELGSAAFSTAYRCIDLSSDDKDGHEEVCLKVIKNTKDFFDQSLDEIKILELLRQTGKCDENYVIRMKTFFYYREHLIIVTELLRQNLFEFGKFIIDNDEEPYFTIPRLAYITRQCLVALRFVHSLGLVHSDVKPENILLGSYSRARCKLIDFGSSCYLTDRQSSYIQSRSYRAPEVVLGLPYDGKIDVWSLGCVVAEMYTGEVTFQNDSIVSMLSRIEAICGSFPRHMIAQGRQSGRFFTKSGLLYEIVDESDNESGKNAPPGPNDDDSESESDTPVHYDVFQPKNTRLSSRLGFDADLMDDYENNSYSGSGDLSEHELQQIFTDFVSRLLTIDPDGRPNANEALQHPWMLYAATLTEEQIKYP
jgi:serine/threonine protein kinase